MWHHTSLNFVHTMKHVLTTTDSKVIAAVMAEPLFFSTAHCYVEINITSRCVQVLPRASFSFSRSILNLHFCLLQGSCGNTGHLWGEGGEEGEGGDWGRLRSTVGEHWLLKQFSLNHPVEHIQKLKFQIQLPFWQLLLQKRLHFKENLPVSSSETQFFF